MLAKHRRLSLVIWWLLEARLMEDAFEMDMEREST